MLLFVGLSWDRLCLRGSVVVGTGTLLVGPSWLFWLLWFGGLVCSSC